ncbi:hypothetical protein AYI69_g1107 [Smittium culicis]|uniref:Dihydrofolate reductase n=1 Tax=Smittium culicis TaxID=133412 RepID=A0A1R1YR78_9FUNG|nr:hypothetical protein AYI69_g1107 [Smittium culicis]
MYCRDEINLIKCCKAVSSFQSALDYIEYLKRNESVENYTVGSVFITGGYGVYKAAMEVDNYKVRVFYTNVSTVDPVVITSYFPQLHKYISFKRKSYDRLQSLAPFTIEKGVLEQSDGIKFEYQLYENWD